MEPTAYLDSLRPAGSKRSSKRDLIINVFLRQEGHLTADDLFDLIRREELSKPAALQPGAPPDEPSQNPQRISRATVYRTLQWMVDAGIARKVDFGEGRFRFEHSYRHPRHFHLICKTCNRSFEFLSSDIEALLEEVAAVAGPLALGLHRPDRGLGARRLASRARSGHLNRARRAWP